MAFDFKNLFKGLKNSIPEANQRVVGIDIGSSSVKVVELEQRVGFATLKTYGELQLGPYADKSLGSVCSLDLEKRTEALVDVLREAGVAATKGVSALSLSSSFITVIGITAKPDEDLNPRVQAEARKYIPVPLSEVTLEWTELPGNESETSRDRVERPVLIAAVQNVAYQEMYQLLQNVNLASQPTEIELFCAQRSITNPSIDTDQETSAIIDFGAQTTKLYIINKGLIRKIHRVFAGGAQVTETIAHKKSISFSEAENAKRAANVEPDMQLIIKQSVDEVYTRPLQEFNRAIKQFHDVQNEQISTVYCSGGGAALSDVYDLTKKTLGQNIQLAHPFAKVAFPAFMEDTLTDISPTFSVALGAALRALES